MKLLSLRFALLAGFPFLCATAPHSATSEIGQTFDGPAGKIYYEVTGTGSNTPLIVVNGGPGFDHTYLDVATAWDTLAKNHFAL